MAKRDWSLVGLSAALGAGIVAGLQYFRADKNAQQAEVERAAAEAAKAQAAAEQAAKDAAADEAAAAASAGVELIPSALAGISFGKPQPQGWTEPKTPEQVAAAIVCADSYLRAAAATLGYPTNLDLPTLVRLVKNSGVQLPDCVKWYFRTQGLGYLLI